MKSSKVRNLLFTLSICLAIGFVSPQVAQSQQQQQQPYVPQYNPLYNTNQYNQQQYGSNQGFGNQQFNNQYNPSSNAGDFLISQQDLQKQSQSTNFQTGNVNSFFDSNKADYPYSSSAASAGTGGLYDEYDESNYCPEHWIAFRQTCYRFVKSPKRSWHDVKKICKAYNGDLLNVDNIDEHSFILRELILSNNKFNRYWISARKTGIKSWVNDDGTAFLPIDDDSFADAQDYETLHPEEYDLSDNRAILDKINQLQRENNAINLNGQSFNRNPLLTYKANWNNIGGLQNPITDAQGNILSDYGRDRLVYGYSQRKDKWIFIPSYDFERHFFICESKHLYSQENVYAKQDEKRTITYGQEYAEEHKIPRGPFFTRQPNDTTFDTSKVRLINDVTLSCLAVGWPTPTYRWYKEEYTNEKLVFREIDSLQDERYLVSGGDLLIQNPTQNQDQGWYHCVAENKFGRVRSNSAQLNFGFIMEFNLKRAAESGDMNWGKALYCDPPQHYPDVKYYWSRGFFPNFVQEDQRVFSSDDGTLYFSSIENVDRANYSCNVQSVVSDTGRAGPFFPLRVLPKNDYQALIFANTFPKMFPEAPIAGSDIRLECVAFGYPVPSYNWTRKGSSLPRNAYQTSFNRVLIIPNATINDNGEYTCTIWNNRLQHSKSLTVNIQMKPNFTIPLKDKIKDYNSDVSFVCEAFAIPDVNYTWYKDAMLLDINKLDKDRYIIQDNVLTIKYLDPEKDDGMYQCRAENQLKAAFSSAQLKVLTMKPSFKKRRMQAEVYAVYNGNTTLDCDPEAAPRPKFQWKKDGNVIGSGGHRRIIPNTGTLIISPTSRDDEGIYTCVASNIAGTDESRVRLIVLQELRFTQALPPKIQTEINKYIYMQCDVFYDEILDVSFSWKHNGQLLTTDDYRRTIVDQNRLTVYNVTMLDAGEYECLVKSSVNQISSKTHVEVFGTPGAPGGVSVINIGKTHATIEWVDGSDNGKPIKWYNILGRTNWNRTFVNVSTEVRAREVDRYTFRMQAEVTNLSPWASYEFSVAAVNDLGIGTPSSPSPSYRTEEDKPYIAPRNVGGGGGKIGDLTITWEPLKPEEENANGIYYKVFWRLHGKWEWASDTLRDNEKKGIATVPIPKDNYYTKYDVKVQAINSVGPGPESEVVTIYSAEDMPQVAPQQTYAKGYNSTCLNVTWLPIEMTREKIRGRLIGHRLKYWKQGQAEEDATYYLSRTTRNWALIVGLQPDTYYLVKVMAYNAAGEGPESERYLERTYRKAPQKPPSSVHLIGINPSTVKVVWRYISPEQDEEPVEGYKVRVWESDQDMVTANDTIIPLGNRLEATIDNLTPGKNYKMRVLAFSNGGDGRMSSPTIQFQMGNTERRNGSNTLSTSFLGVFVSLIICLFFKKF